MSATIMTRWYRAPEVILLQDYDPKIDMWSLGSIFAELCNFTAAYQEQEPDLSKRNIF